MPLSDATIRSLKRREKAYKVSDFDGLFVLVKPTGSRLWQFKYRLDGKEKLLSIGPYPEVTLAEARAARDAARVLVAKGNDPSAAKQDQKREEKERRGLTFETQAHAYFDKTRKEGRASSTLDKTQWLLDMAIADFGRKSMSEITSPMVLRCLRKVEARGNYETAKRLRAKISAVFRFAVASGTATTDPTYALKDALIRPKAKSRAAITDPAKLGELMRAIDGLHGQAVTRIALQLLAFPKPQMGLREGSFAVLCLSRDCYGNAGRVRDIIKGAFVSAGLPAFAPHSFRKTLTVWADRHYATREGFKAFSQNIAHDSVVTTVGSYPPVSRERQRELVRGGR